MACNHGLLSVNYGLLWCMACYFALLGVPGRVTMVLVRVLTLVRLLIIGSFQKSGVLIETPNSRAHIVGTPTKRPPNLKKQPESSYKDQL